MEQGVNFALKNVQRNRVAGWASGSEADALPAADRAAFNEGVRLVEDLSFEQQLAAKHLLDGSANAGDAAQLPAAVVTELRKRDTTLDFVLSLVEQGKAVAHLPPYED